MEMIPRTRCSDESGETMVETLVSILITSLALMLLATAIGTAVNMIVWSKKSMDEYYQGESALVGERKPELGAQKTLTIEDPSGGTDWSTIDVLVYEDDQSGIVFYERKNDESGL